MSANARSLPDPFEPYLQAWLNARPLEQQDVPELSHYTSAEGLLGITRGNCLWATSALYSNDRSEVLYAQSVATEVFTRLQAGAGPDSDQREFLSVTRRILAEGEASEADAYVTSFCEQTDLLSQWRAYGKHGGFEIRFKGLVEVNPLLGSEGLQLSCPIIGRRVLRRVEYVKERQRESFQRIMEAGLRVVTDLSNLHTPGHVSYVAAVAILEGLEWLYTTKHEGFAEEREWRVIAFPKRAAGLAGAAYETYQDLRFRFGRYCVVPYVELSPSSGRLPISSVICGPSSHHILTRRAVELLLASQGFENVAVQNSKVPFAE